MSHRVETLSNGLPLLVNELPYLRSSAAVLTLDAGSRDETEGVHGGFHFLEHYFGRGGEGLPTFRDINTAVSSLGGTKNATTSLEYTNYYIKVPADNLERALQVLSVWITKPLFSKEFFELEKEIIMRESKSRGDVPANRVSREYYQLVFGSNHPMGRPVIGTDLSITNMTYDALMDLRKNYYGAGNLVLSVAGNTPPNIVDLAEEHFSSIPQVQKGSYIGIEKGKNKNEPVVGILNRNNPSSYFILGVDGVSVNDDRRFGINLITTILGGEPSSRLNNEIREKRGFTYGATAVSDNFRDGGLVSITAQVNGDKLDEVLQIVTDELTKLAETKVGESELFKAKEYLKGKWLTAEDDALLIAKSTGRAHISGKSIDLDEIMQKIDVVSPDVILELSQQLFRSQGKYLQIMGPVVSPHPYYQLLDRSLPVAA